MNTSTLPLSARRRARSSRLVLALVCGLSGALSSGLARAAEGPFDFVFQGRMKATSSADEPGPISWKFGEYSALRLVPAEPASPPHAQPLTGAPLETASALVELLASVQFKTDKGQPEPLFDRDEAQSLAPVLLRALQVAQPEQELLLLSGMRRGGSFLTPQWAVTARLFLAPQGLQLIVGQTRGEAVLAWRASRELPSLNFGSRQQATPGLELASAKGRALRPDWLSLPLPGSAAPVPSPSPAPVPTAAASAAAAAAAPPNPAEAVAQRLRTLQSLRDQGLISAEEFRAQRERILQAL